jgi:hypothetical protein
VKPILGTLLVLAGLIALLAGLVRGLDVAEPLVPDPESVSNSFVGALSAGRYEIARQELSDDLKSQISAGDLRELDEEMQQQFGAYRPVPGGEPQKNGDQAIYEVQVDTESGKRLQPVFELERDPRTGLWQITSFDELRGLS